MIIFVTLLESDEYAGLLGGLRRVSFGGRGLDMAFDVENSYVERTLVFVKVGRRMGSKDFLEFGFGFTLIKVSLLGFVGYDAVGMGENILFRGRGVFRLFGVVLVGKTIKDNPDNECETEEGDCVFPFMVLEKTGEGCKGDTAE
jgi:hypothetical protein